MRNGHLCSVWLCAMGHPSIGLCAMGHYAVFHRAGFGSPCTWAKAQDLALRYGPSRQIKFSEVGHSAEFWYLLWSHYCELSSALWGHCGELGFALWVIARN
jgi:hypothetical protein